MKQVLKDNTGEYVVLSMYYMQPYNLETIFLSSIALNRNVPTHKYCFLAGVPSKGRNLNITMYLLRGNSIWGIQKHSSKDIWSGTDSKGMARHLVKTPRGCSKNPVIQSGPS